MKPIYTTEFTLSDMHTDCFGRLKTSALLQFVQEAAGQHCALLAVDREKLSHLHLFWAISRSRVQITRLPEIGEKITLQTWPMPTTRVAYPRSVVAYDEQNQELFRSVSLWILMDEQARTMVLPGKSGITVDGISTGTELAVPHAIAARPMENTADYKVGYSLLDRNGHMNNTRYMDWVADLLSAAFHKQHPAREFTVCYLNEAREGDEIAVHFELSDGPALTVDATRQGERIFSAQVIF